MASKQSRFYPEVGAGGFSKCDGTVEFYSRVNALLQPADIVLDYGAGRGSFLEDPVEFRRSLRKFRGRAAEVVGADVDPAVLSNETVDRAVMIDSEGLPLSDSSVDLVVSDHVLEHVEDPSLVADDLCRVLRSGGWLCARTPNKWGPIGVGSRLVPNYLHRAALSRLQPQKRTEDTFPTKYRLNTSGSLKKFFPMSRWEHYVYHFESELTYGASSMALVRGHRLYLRLAPESGKSILMVFLRKR